MKLSVSSDKSETLATAPAVGFTEPVVPADKLPGFKMAPETLTTEEPDKGSPAMERSSPFVEPEYLTMPLQEFCEMIRDTIGLSEWDGWTNSCEDSIAMVQIRMRRAKSEGEFEILMKMLERLCHLSALQTQMNSLYEFLSEQEAEFIDWLDDLFEPPVVYHQRTIFTPEAAAESLSKLAQEVRAQKESA